MPPALNDLALTVEEREEGQFYWILLQAMDSGAADTLDYRVFRSAARPQSRYSNALALGVAELKRIDPAAAPTDYH